MISTCNYLAREYGVHSAMSSARALQLCPKLLILPVRMQHYIEVGRQIRMIFNEYSPFVEPLSLDEAFLDVTDCKQCNGSATWIAEEIRSKILQRQQLTASAGVAPNKFLAKIASDWNKPNGIFVITPPEVTEFINQLPVKKIFGVGKVTASKLEQLGVRTCGDLQQFSLLDLTRKFGTFGGRLYELARGIDNRKVESRRVRKSLSVERTFSEDIGDAVVCEQKLEQLFTELQRRLQKHATKPIEKQYVKVKFADFTLTTNECISNKLSFAIFQELFRVAAKRETNPIRLIGLGVRFLVPEKQLQQELPGISLEDI